MSAPIIIWTTSKTNIKNASKQLAKKTAEMEALGYEASEPLVSQAGRSKKSWLLLGILNFARSHQVQLTVKFTLKPVEVAPVA